MLAGGQANAGIDGGKGRITIAAAGAGQRAGQHGGQQPELAAPLVFLHARQVALGNVGNLVRQHRGHLGFALRAQQQAAVDANDAARQGKRVDAAVVDGEKVELQLRRLRGGGQRAAQIVQVIAHLGIVDDVAFVPQRAQDVTTNAVFVGLRQRRLGDGAQIGQLVRAASGGGPKQGQGGCQGNQAGR